MVVTEVKVTELREVAVLARQLAEHLAVGADAYYVPQTWARWAAKVAQALGAPPDVGAWHEASRWARDTGSAPQDAEHQLRVLEHVRQLRRLIRSTGVVPQTPEEAVGMGFAAPAALGALAATSRAPGRPTWGDLLKAAGYGYYAD